MKLSTRFFSLTLVLLIASSIAFSQANPPAKDFQPPKLTAAQVIEKHLASIGTPEALAAVKSRVMTGTGALLGGQGVVARLVGPAQLASEGDKILMAMVFDLKDYPYEKVGYDGDSLTVGRPFGDPSMLGEFLKSNTFIFKSGLFGGALSTDWVLAHPQKGVKFEYGGIKDLGGSKAYKLKFSSSSLNGSTVYLYFDAATFHHVLTEYNYTISSTPSFNINYSQNLSYFTMTEQFSDFVKVDDLVLPLRYQIDVSNQYPEGAVSMHWNYLFNKAYNNQSLDRSVFKVS